MGDAERKETKTKAKKRIFASILVLAILATGTIAMAAANTDTGSFSFECYASDGTKTAYSNAINKDVAGSATVTYSRLYGSYLSISNAVYYCGAYTTNPTVAATSVFHPATGTKYVTYNGSYSTTIGYYRLRSQGSAIEAAISGTWKP